MNYSFVKINDDHDDSYIKLSSIHLNHTHVHELHALCQLDNKNIKSGYRTEESVKTGMADMRFVSSIGHNQMGLDVIRCHRRDHKQLQEIVSIRNNRLWKSLGTKKWIQKKSLLEVITLCDHTISGVLIRHMFLPCSYLHLTYTSALNL